MADPQQDWFASNAPPPVPAQTGGDWFATNAPQEKPIPILEGYQRAGRILKEAGKDLAGAVGGMADVMSSGPLTGPMKLGMGITGRYADAYQSAKTAANEGNTTESMVKSAAVPFAPLGIDEIYNDAKAGNNDAAIGKGISRALQVAGPEIAPHVLPDTMPKIPLPEGGDLAAKAKAVGKVAGQWAVAKVPIAGELVRRPSVFDWFEAFKAKADPQLALYDKTPKLGDSPLFSTADVKPEGTASGPVEAPAAQPEPPKSVNADLPRTNSGEGVLNQALTSLDNATLLKVAKSRGLNVTKEAQLKAGAANGPLIKKIIDDFSPEELDDVRDKGIEASRNKPLPVDGATPEAAAEAWRSKVLQTFFPDVKVSAAMQTRVAKTLQQQLQARFEAARAAAESKANAVPVDDLQGGHAGNGVTSVEELSRPGINYVVSKSGQLTYQGKAFAPESTPNGASHVTVLPDGSIRVNAGPQLNASQTGALRFALKKQPWLKTMAAKAGD